jgi:uncharacterized membrane protein YecN with MAPEG domain
MVLAGKSRGAIMAFPYVTAAEAVFLAVLQMLLLLYTARGRGRYRTGLGEGENPALLKRIRMHGNLAENAPLFLILLGLTETTGQWAMIVPWIAIAFAVCRIAHALGLSMSSGLTIFRFLGVVGTVVSILTLAVLLAITLSHDTHWMHV